MIFTLIFAILTVHPVGPRIGPEGVVHVPPVHAVGPAPFKVVQK